MFTLVYLPSAPASHELALVASADVDVSLEALRLPGSAPTGGLRAVRVLAGGSAALLSDSAEDALGALLGAGARVESASLSSLPQTARAAVLRLSVRAPAADADRVMERPPEHAEVWAGAGESWEVAARCSLEASASPRLAADQWRLDPERHLRFLDAADRLVATLSSAPLLDTASRLSFTLPSSTVDVDPPVRFFPQRTHNGSTSFRARVRGQPPHLLPPSSHAALVARADLFQGAEAPPEGAQLSQRLEIEAGRDGSIAAVSVSDRLPVASLSPAAAAALRPVLEACGGVRVRGHLTTLRGAPHLCLTVEGPADPPLRSALLRASLRPAAGLDLWIAEGADGPWLGTAFFEPHSSLEAEHWPVPGRPARLRLGCFPDGSLHEALVYDVGGERQLGRLHWESCARLAPLVSDGAQLEATFGQPDRAADLWPLTVRVHGLDSPSLLFRGAAPLRETEPAPPPAPAKPPAAKPEPPTLVDPFGFYDEEDPDREERWRFHRMLEPHWGDPVEFRAVSKTAWVGVGQQVAGAAGLSGKGGIYQIGLRTDHARHPHGFRPMYVGISEKGLAGRVEDHLSLKYAGEEFAGNQYARAAILSGGRLLVRAIAVDPARGFAGPEGTTFDVEELERELCLEAGVRKMDSPTKKGRRADNRHGAAP